MFRFFVTKKVGDYFELSLEVLHHLKVARVKNDFICIYQKTFYQCNLVENKALIKQKLVANHEFNQQVVVAMSLIKTKRFEWLIQKAAELGATKLIPTISTYVNHQQYSPSKLKRWQTISQNACEQAFRNQIMEIAKPQPLIEVLQLNYQHKYLAHEKAPDLVSKSLPTNTLLVIGPEGGFTDQEIKLAQQYNFKIVKLGPRILRSETAALFLLSKIDV